MQCDRIYMDELKVEKVNPLEKIIVPKTAIDNGSITSYNNFYYKFTDVNALGRNETFFGKKAKVTINTSTGILVQCNPTK
jgi:hypothetical protein